MHMSQPYISTGGLKNSIPYHLVVPDPFAHHFDLHQEEEAFDNTVNFGKTTSMYLKVRKVGKWL